MSEVTFEVVENVEFTKQVKGSMYDKLIEKANAMSEGQTLEVNCAGKKHLRNTLHQLIKRRGFESLKIRSMGNKETLYLVKE